MRKITRATPKRPTVSMPKRTRKATVKRKVKASTPGVRKSTPRPKPIGRKY
jgi:hypothetical protein